MKINKTLAAGLAATLAVTSLASVSGAVVQHWTWDMAKTYGEVTWNPKAVDSAGNALAPMDPGSAFNYVAGDNTAGTKPRDFAIKGVKENAGNGATSKVGPFTAAPVAGTILAFADGDRVNYNGDTNGDGINNEFDFDYFIPFSVEAITDDILDGVKDITVTIEGKKLASDGATTENLTQKVKLLKINNAYTWADAAQGQVAADLTIQDNELTSIDEDADALYILPIYTSGGPANDAFVPERFVQIDKISFTVATGNAQVTKGLNETQYNYLADSIKDWEAAILGYCNTDDKLVPFGEEGKIVGAWNRSDQGYFADATATFTVADGADTDAADIIIKLSDAFVADPNGNNNNNKVVYQLITVLGGKESDKDLRIVGNPITLANAATTATGAAAAADANDGGLLFSKIESYLQKNIYVKFFADKSSMKTYDDFAWLPRTERYPNGTGARVLFNPVTGIEVADPGMLWEDDNEILQRDEIWKLSDTRDYNSQSVAATGSETISNTQTYKVTDDKGNEGTIPKGFNGMASKFADFFNSAYGEAPKKEAKVIFKFTKKNSDAAGSTWKNGGIPSTEVGLRNFLDAQDVKDFALFVNYNATTGSLQAAATLKPESGEVEFDVSDILVSLKGSTIGVVQDIYYGLANGASKVSGWDGLWVEEVRYEYNDDAASETDAKSDEKKEDEKPAEGDKSEKPAEGDKTEDPNAEKEINVDGNEKETEIPSDTKTNDGNNGNAVVDTGSKEVDPNPHTGVALAVIPAIVAGAAVVVSKKRK